MFLEKGVCSIWKNVSYIAATILPVLAEGDRVSYLLSALCMFSSPTRKGTWKLPFPAPAWRPAAPEFWSRIPRSLPARPQKAGSQDRIPGSLPAPSGRRKSPLCSRSGRLRFIFPALEADACAFVYQTGLVVEECLRHHADIQERQGMAVPSPFLHRCDPLGGTGLPRLS